MSVLQSRARAMRDITFFFLAAVFSVACQPSAGGDAAETSSRLPLTPCQLSGDGMPDRLQAKCGTLEVFENRAAGTGRKIPVNVAVLEATGSKVAPDPLFLLAGGPGTAATEVYPALIPALARINQRRDIVLVDQRGTGKSNALQCPQLEEEAPDNEPLEASVARVKACLQVLNGDPRYYTTTLGMADLDDVRDALGYEHINLYGGSYGTRAAFIYMRQYPDRVRSVILDGVAPPDWPIGLTMARDAQRSYELLLDRCARDPGCSKTFPQLKQEFQTVLERLEHAPVKVTVPDPTSGEDKEVEVTRTRAVGTVRTLSYFGETQSFLPLLIHTAFERQDYAQLAAQSLMLGDLVTINTAMHLSVVCAEDAPFMTADAARSLSENTYVGDAAIKPYLDACPHWPVEPLAPNFHAPVTSDVPVLLFSGELDPVTPPSNAELAARTLSHARHVVVLGEGHGVINRGCVPRIAAAFIDAGTVDNLDVSCLDGHRPLPFFLSLRGPQP